MHRRRSTARLAALVALLGGLGCTTEDPVLDRVGGTGRAVDGRAGDGKAGDGRAECSSEVPDAAPRLFPCDVEAVLAAKCQRCHNSNAVLNRCYPKSCVKAPFPLLTWSDTHQPYGDRPIFEAMHQAVETDYMPFKTTDISPPVAPLTAEEKATLLAWTAACAPAGSRACASDAGALDGAGGGDK